MISCYIIIYRYRFLYLVRQLQQQVNTTAAAAAAYDTRISMVRTATKIERALPSDASKVFFKFILCLIRIQIKLNKIIHDSVLYGLYAIHILLLQYTCKLVIGFDMNAQKTEKQCIYRSLYTYLLVRNYDDGYFISSRQVHGTPSRSHSLGQSTLVPSCPTHRRFKLKPLLLLFLFFDRVDDFTGSLCCYDFTVVRRPI